MEDQWREEFDRVLEEFHKARKEHQLTLGDIDAATRFYQVISELKTLQGRYIEALRQGKT